MSPETEISVRHLLEALRGFTDQIGDHPDNLLFVDLLATGLKLAQEKPGRGDLKILLSSLKELRYAFKVFAPYRQFRKVSIFGSARTDPQAAVYRHAFEFANRMSRLGYMVITGAGGGIMAAAQGGAGREQSFGVNIRLPMEQQANETIRGDPKLINFKYFFTRKVIFVKETSAIAIFPGGFGTHDEAFESLTLLQTGKCDPMPLVFIDQPGGSFWKGWRGYLEDHLLKTQLIDPEDMDLFKITDDLDEACEEISRFYRNYHSSRFVLDQFVIRLNRPVGASMLEEINRLFADLLSHGRFELAAALPEENDRPELSRLPRLVFSFNRRSLGRLRQLIDRLNQV